MVELRPSNYLEVLEKYESGCEKNCDECPAFVQKFRRCVFEDERLWNKWSIKKHNEFQKWMEEQ